MGKILAFIIYRRDASLNSSDSGVWGEESKREKEEVESIKL